MKKYCLFAISVILGLYSCINTNTPSQSSSADITFTVQSGTSKSFPSATFDKNVVKGTNGKDTLYVVVSNKDSLPYLTNPDSLVPVISGNNLKSVKITLNDTTTFTYSTTKSDTISFRDTVKIVTVSEDGKHSLTFKVVVNIHQHDPDLYVWTPKASSIYPENAVAEKLVFADSLLLYVKTASNVVLYTSTTDGATWGRKTLTNFPNSFDIKYLVKNQDKLYIAENQEVYASSDGISWTKYDTGNSINHLEFALNGEIFGVSGNPVVLQVLDTTAMSWGGTLSLPSNFPIENEGIFVTNGTAGNERVFVVGGKDASGTMLNTVFSSEYGSYWTNLASINVFSPRIDVAAVQYDNVLMLFGGRDGDGILGIDNYFAISPDYGISWRTPYTNMVMPIDLTPRYNCQVVVNNEKTIIYFVGGQNDSGFTKDAWAVMKNSVLWDSMQ